MWRGSTWTDRSDRHLRSRSEHSRSHTANSSLQSASSFRSLRQSDMSFGRFISQPSVSRKPTGFSSDVLAQAARSFSKPPTPHDTSPDPLRNRASPNTPSRLGVLVGRRSYHVISFPKISRLKSICGSNELSLSAHQLISLESK